MPGEAAAVSALMAAASAASAPVTAVSHAAAAADLSTLDAAAVAAALSGSAPLVAGWNDLYSMFMSDKTEATAVAAASTPTAVSKKAAANAAAGRTSNASSQESTALQRHRDQKLYKLQIKKQMMQHQPGASAAHSKRFMSSPRSTSSVDGDETDVRSLSLEDAKQKVFELYQQLSDRVAKMQQPAAAVSPPSRQRPPPVKRSPQQHQKQITSVITPPHHNSAQMRLRSPSSNGPAAAVPSASAKRIVAPSQHPHAVTKTVAVSLSKSLSPKGTTNAQSNRQTVAAAAAWPAQQPLPPPKRRTAAVPTTIVTQSAKASAKKITSPQQNLSQQRQVQQSAVAVPSKVPSSAATASRPATNSARSKSSGVMSPPQSAASVASSWSSSVSTKTDVEKDEKARRLLEAREVYGRQQREKMRQKMQTKQKQPPLQPVLSSALEIAGDEDDEDYDEYAAQLVYSPRIERFPVQIISPRQMENRLSPRRQSSISSPRIETKTTATPPSQGRQREHIRLNLVPPRIQSPRILNASTSPRVDAEKYSPLRTTPNRGTGRGSYEQHISNVQDTVRSLSDAERDHLIELIEARGQNLESMYNVSILDAFLARKSFAQGQREDNIQVYADYMNHMLLHIDNKDFIGQTHPLMLLSLGKPRSFLAIPVYPLLDANSEKCLQATK